MAPASDIRLSFDKVPTIYDLVRPTYPDKLMNRLFEHLPDGPNIVEVGPGTGQATAALLDRGATVTAVELGPELSAFLSAKLPSPRLHVVNAAFEEAELKAKSFDAVVAATCYHWIGPREQIARPHELLTPGGTLAIIDLIQVQDPSGYFDRVQPIYDRFGQAQGHDWSPPTYDSAEPKITSALRASDRFTNVQLHRVPWDQTYTSSQYRQLLRTYSGTQMLAEPERSNMVDQLVAVIDSEFERTLTRPLVACLTLATSLDRSND